MSDFFKERMANREGDLKKLEEFNLQTADWYVVCPKCKVEIRGTLAQVKGHVCGR